MVSQGEMALPRHPLQSKMPMVHEATAGSTSVGCLDKGVSVALQSVGALGVTGLGSLCDADVPQGS